MNEKRGEENNWNGNVCEGTLGPCLALADGRRTHPGNVAELAAARRGFSCFSAPNENMDGKDV